MATSIGKVDILILNKWKIDLKKLTLREEEAKFEPKQMHIAYFF